MTATDRSSRAAGFTLVETLLALAILAAAAAGMLEVRSRALEGAAAARESTEAALIAGRVLSEIALDPPDASSPFRAAEGDAGYSWRVRVEGRPLAGLGPVRVAVVEVRREDAAVPGGREVLRVETLLAPAMPDSGGWP